MWNVPWLSMGCSRTNFTGLDDRERFPSCRPLVLPPSGSASVADIANRIVSCGKAWISAAKFEDYPVLRACITHGQTGEPHIRQLVETLEVARRATA
jgi:hypothetical protein